MSELGNGINPELAYSRKSEKKNSIYFSRYHNKYGIILTFYLKTLLHLSMDRAWFYSFATVYGPCYHVGLLTSGSNFDWELRNSDFSHLTIATSPSV